MCNYLIVAMIARWIEGETSHGGWDSYVFATCKQIVKEKRSKILAKIFKTLNFKVFSWKCP